MPFENSISVEQVLKEKGITAQQIAETYVAFRRLINKKSVLYESTNSNLSAMIDFVFADASVEGLLDPAEWLKSFHEHSAELPDQPISPEQKARERAQELENRDREAGSISSSNQYLSDADRAALAEKREAAFQATKKELADRVNQIRNATSEPTPQRTTADALAELKSTNMERSKVVAWIRNTPSDLYVQVRKLPYGDRKDNRTFGDAIDAAVSGKSNA